MNTSNGVATTRLRVEMLEPGEPTRARIDEVAVEAPLEVRFGGKPATVLLRTPGHDEELVLGFLFSEGLIARAADVLEMTRPEGLAPSLAGNVIEVRFTARRRAPVSLDRTFYSSASCGACGKLSIASLEVNAPRVESGVSVHRDVLTALPARLKEAQPTFALTGGVHASGLFTSEGRLVAVREDVGRHNALDKLVGWSLTASLPPLHQHLLLLSGRVSYELVQKSIMAGIPIIAAVGAPSSLAIELADRFQITLAGFLRGGSMNVYTHSQRIVFG